MRKFFYSATALIVIAFLAMFGGVAHASTPHIKAEDQVCGSSSNQQCNISMDGTSGDKVNIFAANNSDSKQAIDWTYLQAPNCPSGVSVVQDGADGDDNCNGVSEWWPFSFHGCDTAHDGGSGVTFGPGGTIAYANDSEPNNVWQTTAAHTGDEWVKAD